MLSPQEIEKIRAAAGAGPIPSQATTSLSSKLGLQKPTEETKAPSLRDRLSSIAGTAADVATGVVKSVGNTANTINKMAEPVMEAIDVPLNKIAQTITGTTDEQAQRAVQSQQADVTADTSKGEELAKTENTAQEVGKSIGDVAQFVAVPEAKGPALVKAVTGFATGAGTSAAQGGTTAENVTSGVIDAAIPGAGPLLKKVGTGIKETLGASTGVGGGVINTAWEAAKAGGKKLEAFKQGLGTSVEAIVTEAKDALSGIIRERGASYSKALEGLKESTKQLDISPINNAVQKGLKDFNVKITKDGLDFSRSKLALDKTAQAEMNQIYETMKTWGTQKGDRLITGVDTLKQMFGDLYSDSSSIRAFSKAVEKAAKDVGKQVPGYEKMLDAYSESTKVIKEIQKGLSLKDNVQVETAFKKLTSALRTNNETRKALVDELDKASGGFLSSKIAGQQMSEVLPRGLTAKLGGMGAMGIGVSGLAGFAQVLPALVLASPKAVQGLLRTIGLPAKYTKPFFDAIAANQKTISGVAQEGARAILDNPEKGN